MGDQLAYSIDEVCAKSGLGRTTIYAAIGDGFLIARKFGRRTIVLDDDLKAFLHNLPPVCECSPRASEIA
jgi:excisionase family DNA binding protein